MRMFSKQYRVCAVGRNFVSALRR